MGVSKWVLPRKTLHIGLSFASPGISWVDLCISENRLYFPVSVIEKLKITFRPIIILYDFK